MYVTRSWRHPAWVECASPRMDNALQVRGLTLTVPAWRRDEYVDRDLLLNCNPEFGPIDEKDFNPIGDRTIGDLGSEDLVVNLVFLVDAIIA